jgi:hypothetical protein
MPLEFAEAPLGLGGPAVGCCRSSTSVHPVPEARHKRSALLTDDTTHGVGHRRAPPTMSMSLPAHGVGIDCVDGAVIFTLRSW